jgi:alpha-aminoadipate carrier protein LysW
MVTCPECDADLEIDVQEIDEGDAVRCESCGTEFEVTGVDPLELEPVSDDDDEEDLEEEEDEEEDDEDLDEDEDDVDDEDDNWDDD